MSRIIIPGKPVPKGRPRFTKTGRTYTPKATELFERRVSTVAALQADEIYSGSVELKIWISFPLLVGGTERKRVGDLDNYAKSIADGLNGILYEDDRQIQSLTVQRTYGSLEGWCAVEVTESEELAEAPLWT
jgi:crossover junction endodeoxyribonuclease RusA